MIEYFEVAMSSRSHCIKCNKRIEKGGGRGVHTETYRGHTSPKYVCLKCSKEVLQDLLEQARDYIVIE